MKKVLILVLTAAMLISCLCGCSLLGGVKLDELVGTWSITMEDTEEEARALLDNIQAYEEEIALADLDSLEYVQVVKFYEDKTYSFGYDADATWQCVYDFYAGFFANLYENRGQLSELYGQDMSVMTEEEFGLFYASMYGAADLESLITGFTDDCYDYAALSVPYETGVFKFESGDMLCKIDGEVKYERLGYDVEGNELTLTFADGREVYVKAG